MAARKGKVVAGTLNYPAIWSRHSLDESNVADLCAALKSGVKLPPITVDPNGDILVAGRHRVEAYIRVFGPEVEIPCVFMEFGNEAERLAFDAAENAAHGLRLQRGDQERVMRLLAITYEWPVSRLSATFQLPVDDIERRLKSIVMAAVKDKPATPLHVKPSMRTRATRKAQAFMVNTDRDAVEEVADAEVIPLQTEHQRDLVDRGLGIAPWLTIRQLADWGNLPAELWPDPTPELIRYLPDAVSFLNSYAASVENDEAEAK